MEHSRYLKGVVKVALAPGEVDWLFEGCRGYLREFCASGVLSRARFRRDNLRCSFDVLSSLCSSSSIIRSAWVLCLVVLPHESM